jgi:hypothetical protein
MDRFKFTLSLVRIHHEDGLSSQSIEDHIDMDINVTDFKELLEKTKNALHLLMRRNAELLLAHNYYMLPKSYLENWE